MTIKMLAAGCLSFLCVFSHSNLSAAGPTRFVDYFSTQSLQLRVDNKTSKTRSILTTSGKDFLATIHQSLPVPNREIVEILLLFPDDGTHTYWWPKASEGSYDGSSTDRYLNGVRVLTGEKNARTFCCGLTLEVFYIWAARNRELSDRLSKSDNKKFKQAWFCRNINSPGPLDALQEFNIGGEVSHSDALPGDFVQLWRNNKSGHSVIFVNWLYDNTGKRIGLQYWSTQPGTSGIGYASEAFGSGPAQINTRNLSVARPSVIN